MGLDDFKQNKDKPFNTLVVAGTLCLVCALVVSTAASALKSFQEANIALDRKKNLLLVAGFTDEAAGGRASIESTYEEYFTATIIDLDTGEEAIEECRAALESYGKTFPDDEDNAKLIAGYDQFKMAGSKNSKVADRVAKKENICNLKSREKFSHVYKVKGESGTVKIYVFPVRGYGLWSMMRGFLAVKPDFQTVEGIVFYDQAETPGLGAEVKSKLFTGEWPGKQIYDDGGEVQIRVIKNADDNHSINALSGATITSNGVTNAMKYWMGPAGFKNYIDRQKSGGEKATSSVTTVVKGANNG